MRHANNLESVLTYEGTSEMHQLVIGQEAHELIESCGVLIENFRSGTMERFGLGYEQVAGANPITGSEESGPMKAGVALVDVITGMHAAVGMLAALTSQASPYVSTARVPAPMGNRHPSIAPYEVVETADRPRAIAAANDELFVQLSSVGVPCGPINDLAQAFELAERLGLAPVPR